MDEGLHLSGSQKHFDGEVGHVHNGECVLDLFLGYHTASQENLLLELLIILVVLAPEFLFGTCLEHLICFDEP